MGKQFTELDGATVRADGTLIDRLGHPTGLQVQPGGFLLSNTAGQTIGVLSMVGRVYDAHGTLVTCVVRRDTRAATAQSATR